jgi:hypothetical protein
VRAPVGANVGPLNRQIDWRGTIAYGGIKMNQNFTAVVSGLIGFDSHESQYWRGLAADFVWCRFET